jgi:hypothetical protein
VAVLLPTESQLYGRYGYGMATRHAPPRARVTDGLWLRLIDVPGALAARQYSCPSDMVIEVRDDLLPATRAADGCGPGTPAPPAARGRRPQRIFPSPTRAGAAYLGGTRIGSLAAAGLVTEHRAGTLIRLSAAMT